jgi:hypothetical protein
MTTPSAFGSEYSPPTVSCRRIVKDLLSPGKEVLWVMEMTALDATPFLPTVLFPFISYGICQPPQKFV